MKRDRLVKDTDIEWYARSNLNKHLDGFNLYCTTDYTASNELKGDYSVVYMWGVTNNRDWFLLDIGCQKTDY